MRYEFHGFEFLNELRFMIQEIREIKEELFETRCLVNAIHQELSQTQLKEANKRASEAILRLLQIVDRQRDEVPYKNLIEKL